MWRFNDGVLWFVRAIIILYLLFATYSWAINKTKKNLPMVLLVLLFFMTIGIWLIDVSFTHRVSVGLFFLGIYVGQLEENGYKRLFWGCFVFILWAIMCAYCITHGDVGIADWGHMLFDIFFVVIFLAVCSKWEVRLYKLPKWIGGCSYDIYLVHNKALMLLDTIYLAIPLWTFAGLTFIFAIIFYNIRKFVHI